MSYGVVASRAAQVQVDHVDSAEPADLGLLARLRHVERASWASGRLTLTTLNLAFVAPKSSGPVDSLTLPLTDVVSVETTTGRVHNTVTIRTVDVVLRARVPGAAAFAKQVSSSVESMRKRNALTRPPVGRDLPGS